MRTGHLSGTALVAVLVLGMTGCVGGDPLPTLPPTPSTTPVFASEEEALAAAEEAYAAYLEMSGLISSEGGVDPERIAPYVTESRLEVELRGFETARENGLRLEGTSQFELLDVQRVEITSANVEVAFYACWDGSGTRVFDSSGADVTPADRDTRMVLEVVMLSPDGDLPLVLESDDPWSASDC